MRFKGEHGGEQGLARGVPPGQRALKARRHVAEDVSRAASEVVNGLSPRRLPPAVFGRRSVPPAWGAAAGAVAKSNPVA
jgi:hypothetical protein